MTSPHLLPSRNIHHNLAIEEHFFRSVKAGFVFYINSPAVVIGRFQNPWHECDLSKLAQNKIALARRTSGGGTVYHDEGNLCLSLIGNIRKDYRFENLQLIVQALSSLGVKTEATAQGDILLNGKKISGSAYKESRGKFLHHLTLLFHADLSFLRGCLVPSFPLEGRFTESRKSSVINICDVHPQVTMSDFIDSFSTQALQELTKLKLSENFEQPLACDDFTSIFGKTPKFIFHPLPHLEVTSEHGRLIRIRDLKSGESHDIAPEQSVILDKTAVLEYADTVKNTFVQASCLTISQFLPLIDFFYK